MVFCVQKINPNTKSLCQVVILALACLLLIPLYASADTDSKNQVKDVDLNPTVTSRTVILTFATTEGDEGEGTPLGEQVINDAERFSDFFLQGDEIQTLNFVDLKKEQIENILSNLKEQSIDTLIVFFSSHGFLNQFTGEHSCSVIGPEVSQFDIRNAVSNGNINRLVTIFSACSTPNFDVADSEVKSQDKRDAESPVFSQAPEHVHVAVSQPGTVGFIEIFSKNLAEISEDSGGPFIFSLNELITLTDINIADEIRIRPSGQIVFQQSSITGTTLNDEGDFVSLTGEQTIEVLKEIKLNTSPKDSSDAEQDQIRQQSSLFFQNTLEGSDSQTPLTLVDTTLNVTENALISTSAQIDDLASETSSLTDEQKDIQIKQITSEINLASESLIRIDLFFNNNLRFTDITHAEVVGVKNNSDKASRVRRVKELQSQATQQIERLKEINEPKFAKQRESLTVKAGELSKTANELASIVDGVVSAFNTNPDTFVAENGGNISAIQFLASITERLSALRDELRNLKRDISSFGGSRAESIFPELNRVTEGVTSNIEQINKPFLFILSQLENEEDEEDDWEDDEFGEDGFSDDDFFSSTTNPDLETPEVAITQTTSLDQTLNVFSRPGVDAIPGGIRALTGSVVSPSINEGGALVVPPNTPTQFNCGGINNSASIGVSIQLDPNTALISGCSLSAVPNLGGFFINNGQLVYFAGTDNFNSSNTVMGNVGRIFGTTPTSNPQQFTAEFSASNIMNASANFEITLEAF